MHDLKPSCFHTTPDDRDHFRAVVERVYAFVVIAESSHSETGVVTDFVVREVSDLACLLTDDLRDELLGAPLSGFLKHSRLRIPLVSCIAAATTGETGVHESDTQPDGGTWKHFRVEVVPVPGGVALLGNDVTDEHRQRSDLERFAAIVDNGRSLVGFVSPRLDRFYLNPTGRALIGLEGEDARTLFSRLPASFRKLFDEQILPDVARKGTWSGETRLSHLETGQPMVLELHCFAVRDRETRRLLCYAAIARDITAVKHAAEDLFRYTREVELARLRIERQAALLAEQAEALRRAKEVAEASTRAKSDFLANMSHEIRTPLTAILGFTEELLEPSLSSQEAAAATRTIQRNGQHLLSLVNDILDLSRIEAGLMTVESIPFSLDELLGDVTSLFSGHSHRGLSFKVERSDSLPKTVSSDAMRIRQILINLVGNAFKFTAEGVVRLSVHWETECDRPRLRFDIHDSGIGMTPEQAERVFQPFSQADTSTSRSYGGTGLGLAVSRRLARLLGGNVVLLASAPDKGSHFRFTANVRSVEEAVSGASATSGRELDAARHQTSAQAVSSDDVAGCRVLVVDDGADNRLLLSKMLSKRGAIVSTVADGRAGVETVLDTNRGTAGFDIILMDMQMPLLDGYDATRMLRKAGYSGPIIALTADAMEGTRSRCIEAGCDDYLTKPFEVATLLPVVHRHLVRGTIRSRRVSP